MRYGKLENNKIVFAPRAITIEKIYYNPTPISWLLENGYKEIVYSEQPEYKEGYYYEEKWQETEEQLVQKWVERKEPEPEPTDSDRVEAIVTYNVMMGNLLEPEEVAK